MLRLSILFLGLFTAAPFQEAIAQLSPSRGHLVSFYRQMLDDPYYGDRMDGIVGLGHLGRAASPAVPELIGKTESGSEPLFYRMLAWWSLARIGTPEGERAVRDKLTEEVDIRREAQLDFHIFAARAALLAEAGVSTREIDRYLPALYNRSRSGDPDERILAAWALLEIGTPVTRETAMRALQEVSTELDPEHGNYTRHLRYLRLLGPHPVDPVKSRLEQILEGPEFEISLAPKRALTAFTLATLSYPQVPASLGPFLAKIRDDLDFVFTRSPALEDILALGPFACTGPIVKELNGIARDSGDGDDREEAREALEICRN